MICDSSSGRGETVPEVRLLGPKGGRHPRMVVPGKSGTPEMTDKYGMLYDCTVCYMIVWYVVR